MMLDRLFVLALTGCAAEAVGEDQSDATTPPPILFDDGRLTVRSSVMTAAAAGELAATAERAYAFDLAQLEWSSPPELDDSFDLVILSTQAMQSEYPGLGGGAIGDREVVFDRATTLLPAFPGVLAHELSHIQMSRMGGGLPHTLEEGKAIVLQRMYLHDLGIAFPEASATEAAYLALTPATADAAIAGFMFAPEADSPIQQDERVGALLVEYARGKLASPYPEMLAQLADCVEIMSSSTAAELPRFDAAFVTELGMTFAQLRASFDAFVASTTGDPATRASETAVAPTY
jgi:hypothetical protein